jgi:hypothetical protein
MRGLELCYYHDRYQPKPGYRNLPCLEDPHSVQCAIQEIIEDMLNGLLDYKKAALALYGLQTAASNLKQMRIAQEKKPETTQQARGLSESFGGDRLQPIRVSAKETPAPAAEVRLSPLPSTGHLEEEVSPTKDLCTSHYDDLEEIELAAGSKPGLKPAGDGELFTGLKAGAPTEKPTTNDQQPTTEHEPPTTNDQQPTTGFVESPRQPQHVTYGLTAAERQRMNEVFPDMKKIRAEFLASLTPEERTRMETPEARG